MSEKTLLYLDATPDNETPKGLIKCAAESYGFEFVERRFTGLEQFSKELAAHDQSIDILYLGAHSNKSNVLLENKNRTVSEELSWEDVAALVCEADGLTERSSLFLGCCDAGFKRTALTFFSTCLKLDVVSGLPCALPIRSEGLAFHIFLDHHWQGNDANRIENAVSTGIGHQFRIYHRHEMDVEIELYSAMKIGRLYVALHQEDEESSE